MDEVTSLGGPVEKIDGQLMLRIPLDAGASELVECSRGVSEIDGDCLKIKIPEWLALKLRIEEGSMVTVDNRDGKFNIYVDAPYSIH